MDRRIALKNMGLAMGYTIAAPTLLGLVQSCKNEKVAEWVPDYLTPDEGSVLKQLVDIVLPKTDTPSASEVNVHVFLDKFMNEVMEKEQQDFIKMTMGKFIDKALTDSNKTNALDLTADDLEPVLASSLKIGKEEQETYFESIQAYMEALSEDETVVLDDSAARFAFANNLRENTIYAYKTSEYVGEQVLAYLPVPGPEYIACGDLQELTGGKAWSI
ncbi:hypothetical protein GGR42_002125 [Saonia flava]|uniref:Gluconate 2-dehydrogenase subunit 3 n=1 Tax=Saonia flava TaxID=523696 RepID=A0A846QZP5_9FLAO|nr:gluconate 2-dehydrogenase subunit 3 family protein [Saonia flava]NJB71663.1 hypothetical protein [Saonia flava]